MTGFIELDGTDIHYETRGEGQPVLFIHAGVADSRMWNEQWAIDGFQLIRFDMRGFGQSSVGTEPFTDSQDAVAVLDHLEVKRAVIVGCSIGAAATLQIADSAPERIAGLVLVGGDAPGFDPGIDYESPEWPEAVKAFEAGDRDRVAMLDAGMWLAGRGRTPSDLDDALVQLFVDMDLIALRNELKRDELEAADPLEGLPDVDAPVKVIVGDRDLPQLVAAAEYLAANMSDRPAEVLEGTAHLPSMDRPDPFNAVIEGFLASI